MITIGLTGGVASGKSTIASMLADHGAAVVDADAISHELTRAGGAAISALRAEFGEEVIDHEGALDRASMRTRAFNHPTARKQLESILHPMIREAMRERALAHGQAGAPYVVLMIPLLIESARANAVDRIMVVDCSESTQLSRVVSRGIDEATARAIIGAQANRSRRLEAADDVLFNEAALRDVAPRVEKLHHEYRRLGGAALAAALE